jgi:hypothetical protein
MTKPCGHGRDRIGDLARETSTPYAGDAERLKREPRTGFVGLRSGEPVVEMGWRSFGASFVSRSRTVMMESMSTAASALVRGTTGLASSCVAAAVLLSVIFGRLVVLSR